MQHPLNLETLTGRKKNKLVQLALSLDKVKTEKLQFPMLVSEKLDGVYCLAIKLSGRVGIYSRTGELFTSMRHIEKILTEILMDDEVIIFEAYAPNTVQSTISGWCRDTKEQHPVLMAVCHDLLFLCELVAGGSVPYANRSALLKLRVDTCRHTTGTRGTYWTVSCVDQKSVGSLKEAQDYADHIIEGGGEGAVLRNPSGLYSPGKRNQDIIKIKQGVSYDLKVIGFQEGRGKYTGTLGALICRWRDGKNVVVSGMTDDQRKLWWHAPGGILGKIVQVDAMRESSKGLLREPRFKGIRYDKTEGDF